MRNFTVSSTSSQPRWLWKWLKLKFSDTAVSGLRRKTESGGREWKPAARIKLHGSSQRARGTLWSTDGLPWLWGALFLVMYRRREKWRGKGNRHGGHTHKVAQEGQRELRKMEPCWLLPQPLLKPQSSHLWFGLYSPWSDTEGTWNTGSCVPSTPRKW